MFSDSAVRDTQQATPPPAANADIAYPPIFIGGAGRSGTTLLRVILDSHSRIACGPELKVIPPIAQLWADFQTTYAPYLAESRISETDVDRAFRVLIASLLASMRRESGKARIAEKTPNNVFFFRHLHRMFPNATYIHMVRDGRDVVASLLTMDWRGPDGEPLEYTTDARLAARYWANSIVAARQFAHHTQGRSRYCELRYEDLIAQPEPCLRALFEFLGEPWEPAVLSFHEREHALGIESSADAVTRPIFHTSVGRWRTQLSAEQRQAVKEEAGNVLLELRYCDNLDW